MVMQQGFTEGLVLADRYQVVRQIGQGGFGRTYLAHDRIENLELCVLKEFAPPEDLSPELRQKALELFQREANTLYVLEHPQIPKFRKLIQLNINSQWHLILVQDYIEGWTYRAILESGQKQGQLFTEADIQQLLRDLLPVLEYIHGQGVIHRDISPDNLLLRSSDKLPILIDFGGVKQIAAQVKSQFQATRIGKSGYCPPEQLTQGRIYPHSDLYALAATAVVLLTGKEPQELINPQTLVWQWRENLPVSRGLAAILERMLDPDPRQRFGDAAQVRQALASNEALQVSPTPLGLVRKYPRLGLTLILGVPLAMVIGWVVGVWVLSRSLTPTPVAPAQPEVAIEALPPQERSRHEALFARQRQLEIDYQFLVELTDASFRQENPNSNRPLSNKPEDAPLRSRWNEIADRWLTQIEQINLSPAARRRMGHYNAAIRRQWQTQVNQANVSTKALYDLVDNHFFLYLPKQQGQDFINEPVGQIWHAIAADLVENFNSYIENLQISPSRDTLQLRSQLAKGQGRIYLAQMQANQQVNFQVNSNDDLLLSIYSPTGRTQILEDSRDRFWSTRLSESGIYEIVLVAPKNNASYQLRLTVR
jgi:serine/threonine-protein kinase